MVSQDWNAKHQAAPALGDLAALAPALRRYFRRRAPAQEVDDLVQEVFVSLHARRAEEPIEDLERYLFTVAGNALVRRRAFSSRWATFEPEEHGGHEDLSPERVVISREDLDRAVGVIASLPARTRQIFILHRFEEMTYPRIAHEVGVSVSAVEKHIMNGLRALALAGLR